VVKFIEGRAGIRNCARRFPFIEPITEQGNNENMRVARRKGQKNNAKETRDL
jgi:hypothetical protein